MSMKTDKSRMTSARPIHKRPEGWIEALAEPMRLMITGQVSCGQNLIDR
jgi:hypothetical protein